MYSQPNSITLGSKSSPEPARVVCCRKILAQIFSQHQEKVDLKIAPCIKTKPNQNKKIAKKKSTTAGILIWSPTIILVGR